MDMNRKYLDGDLPSGNANSVFCDLMTQVDTFNKGNNSCVGKGDLFLDIASERPIKNAECLEAVEKYSLKDPSLAQPTRNIFNDIELKVGRRRMNLFCKISQSELKDVGKPKRNESCEESSQKINESDRRAEGPRGCPWVSTSVTGTSKSSFESRLHPWSYGHSEQNAKVARNPEPFLLRRLGHRGSVLHIGRTRRRKKRK